MPVRLIPRAAIVALMLAVAVSLPNAGPANAAVGPTAFPGGPYVTVEGADTLFSSTITDPGDGAPYLYEWDFDYDGATFAPDQSATALSSPVHRYVDDAVTLVAVRLTDGVTTGSITTSSVIVQNLPPVAFAGGPYEVDTGASLSIHGSAVDAGEDSLIYEWDFEFAGGEFSADATGAGLSNPSHTYTSAGSSVIALRVRDDDGGLSSVSLALVEVAAVGPEADAGGPYLTTNGLPISTESAITFSGSATQAAAGDLTFEWEFEHNGCNFVPDLSGIGLTDPVHLYPTRGAYLVALRVTDSDGTVGAVSTAPVRVADDSGVLPTGVNAGGPYVVDEGGSVAIAGSATSSPLGAGFTFDWDLNNQCTFDQPGQNATFSAAGLDGPDEKEITLRITDPSDGAASAGTTTVSILNAPPVASLDLPDEVTSGVNKLLFASALDPGAGDLLSFAWDFESDGKFDAFGNPVNFSKTVDATTEITVTVRVSDDDGASDEASDVMLIRTSAGGVVADPTPVVTPVPSPTPAPIPEVDATPDAEPTLTPVATPIIADLPTPSPVPSPTPVTPPPATPRPLATVMPTPAPTVAAASPVPTAAVPSSTAAPATVPPTETPASADTPTPEATVAATLDPIPEPPAPPPVRIAAVLLEAKAERDAVAVSESGDLSVRIPAGTLPEATELFAVSTSPQSTLAQGPDGTRVAGAAIEIGTGNPDVVFTGPVEISVVVNQTLIEAAGGNLANITFRQLDPETGQWRVARSRVEDGGLIVVDVEGPGRLVPTVPGPPSRPREVLALLSPDEERVLAASDRDDSVALVIVVPPAAVDRPLSLVYAPQSLTGSPPANEGETLVGTPFELTAFLLAEEQKDFVFGRSIDVFVPLGPEQVEFLESGLTLTLVFFDDRTDDKRSEWRPVPTFPVEGGLRAEVSHLSLFAISVNAEIDRTPGTTLAGPAALYFVSPFDNGAPPRSGEPVTATLMLDPGGIAIEKVNIRLVSSSESLQIRDFVGAGLCVGMELGAGQGGPGLDCIFSGVGYTGAPIAIGQAIVDTPAEGDGTISIVDNSPGVRSPFGFVSGLSLTVQPALTIEAVNDLIRGGGSSVWRWLGPVIAVPALVVLLILTYANRRRIARLKLQAPNLRRPPLQRPTDRPAPRQRRDREPGPSRATTAGGLVMLAMIVAIAAERKYRRDRRKRQPARPPLRKEFSWRE